MNKEVENAKQCIKNSCEGLALETIEKYYNKEIDRLNNIINEIEEYILNHYIVGHTIQNASLDDILNKLKELKEKSDINNNN